MAKPKQFGWLEQQICKNARKEDFMSEQQKQISKLAGALTEFQHCFSVMSTEDRQWAIQNAEAAIGLFANAVKNRIAPKLEEVMSNVFHLTVDYSQSLEQMIAAGRYDWRNDDITAKRFPIKGEGIVEYEARYFNFDRNISSENTIDAIEAEDTANPWSAAKIEHVLSHGERLFRKSNANSRSSV